MELFAVVFLAIFIAWLFSKPHGGGHRPPTKPHPIPRKPPPPPPPPTKFDPKSKVAQDGYGERRPGSRPDSDWITRG